MLEPFSDVILWMVVAGFVIAFILAFGIGANDVANSFGTSVGSGVLTIRQACWLATVCEVSGAVLIGYKVSDTMRKGILDVTMYTDAEIELTLGCLSALGSSALWLLVATFFKLPISGTHSIVGSTIGFSLVARGTKGVQWRTLGTIVGSWFISPVFSGIMSTILFWCIRKFILTAKNPLRSGLYALPIFYGLTLFVNVFSIVHDGPKLLYMDNIPTWIAFTVSLTIGITIAILVQIFIVPWQRRKVLGQTKSNKPVKFSIDGSVESSPNVSPKRNNRRSVSMVTTTNDGDNNGSCSGGGSKVLASITETTELVSFKDGFHGYGDRNLMKNLMLNDLSQQLNNVNYNFNPKIIERAEYLLGKSSLDNTDLTITSLNYIDEQNGSLTTNGTGGGVGTGGRGNLQAYFDRQNSRSPDALSKSIKSPSSIRSCDTSTMPITDLPTVPTSVFIENDVIKTELNHHNHHENGSTSVEQMITSTLSPNSSKLPLIESHADNARRATVDVEPEDMSTLFSFLQILTASFGSFAHGGNDVSNAIGPLIAIWMIFKDGTVLQQSETPVWILIFGGIGISLGLWVWGRRVIQTVGNDLTKITPSTGFTIEIGAAMTVLLASKIGLPISTTHCKVGSVVFVGYTNGPSSTKPKTLPDQQQPTGDGIIESQPTQEKSVDWALFRNIVYAWVVTVPVAAVLSAAFMFVLQKLVL